MTPKKIMVKSRRGQTRQRGQIVVEYVLLLIVAVAIVTVAVRALVRRENGEGGGIIIQVWSEMLQAIGQDPADEVK